VGEKYILVLGTTRKSHVPKEKENRNNHQFRLNTASTKTKIRVSWTGLLTEKK